MSVISCQQNLRKLKRDHSEALKTEAAKIAGEGLNELGFYSSDVFRRSIERVGGQFPPTKGEPSAFVRTDDGSCHLLPASIYVMPFSIASSRNNIMSPPLEYADILKALHECFRGKDEEPNDVDFEDELCCFGEAPMESKFTPIQGG